MGASSKHVDYVPGERDRVEGQRAAAAAALALEQVAPRGRPLPALGQVSRARHAGERGTEGLTRARAVSRPGDH